MPRLGDGRALLLTEAGTERKAGVWVVAGDPDGGTATLHTDTGGLVKDDWVTPEASKLAALAPILG